MSKGKNSAGSSKSSTSSANTATVNGNVGDPDSDTTASEVPQVLPLSTNPEPGNEDIDTDRCCMFFFHHGRITLLKEVGLSGFFCLCD